MNMPPRAASPWDVLLQAPRNRAPVPAAAAAESARPGTKLAALLAELAQTDSTTTLALAVRADLTPRQVWGLLKDPRATGQVTFSAGRWALNAEWQGRDVERAAELLRSKGWRVTPPNVRVDLETTA